MNFKAHVTGALVGGAIAAGVGVVALDLSVQSILTKPFFSNPDFLQFSYIFGLAWFMALFPDLDTASIPQRWFYRFLLVAMIVAIIKKEIDIFAVMAFLGIVPLLDRHRGWTHWRTAPWIMAFAVAILIEYMRVKGNWFLHFKWKLVLYFFENYWVYVFAMVFGHYIHLFLDSKKAKKLPFFKEMAKW